MSKILGVNSPKPEHVKNYIINGNFDIWQRGTSGILTSTDTAQHKACDRFYTYRTSSTAFTMSQQTGDFSTYAARFQRTAADTSTTTMYAGQVIETAEAVKLAGKTITLSFYAKAGANFSSSGSGLTLFMITSTGTDQGSQGSISGTWSGYSASLNTTKTITISAVRYSYTVTIPSGTKEIAILFSYGGSGTAGANDWFQLEQVMLNEGSVAAPFQTAGDNIEDELAMCQKYYQKTFPLATTPAQNAGAAGAVTIASVGAGGFGNFLLWNFPVIMRGSPTIVTYNPSAANANARNFALSADRAITSDPFGVSSQRGVGKVVDSTGDTLGQHVGIHYTADAEL